MLESVFVVLHIMVVVVGIGKEVVVHCEDVAGGDIWRGEPEAFGAFYFIHLSVVVAEVFAELVAEVGVGVFVAHHLYCVVYMDCAVVGGKHHSCTAVSHFLKNGETTTR